MTHSGAAMAARTEVDGKGKSPPSTAVVITPLAIATGVTLVVTETARYINAHELR